ncbi:MAG TPA: phosphoribosylanthranilate isomerase [Deinococcales bacterium]|nr:phosphoribosylanthranilate isomerase [Deinococcales bacterium]
MIRVKICGITRPEDAVAAEAAGADAVGLIFAARSKRRVTTEQAREASEALGPFIARVGVFVDWPLPELLAVAREARLTTVQLHGSEPDGYAAAVARHYPVLVARKVVPGLSLALPPVGTPLVDGPEPGSGEAFAWDEFDRAPLAGRAWVLAGGLTPKNVSQAVRALRPWGVDVASGVESAPGIKDHQKVQDFITAARG